VQEVREAIPAAFAGEFGELPDGFKRGAKRVFLAGGNGGLIDPRESGEMERLRAEGAGHSLAMLILDCIEDAFDRGKQGSEALIDGTAAALAQCYNENARSIEEHAQRYCLGEVITQRIRRRLAEASPSPSDLDAVARGLWKLAPQRVGRTPPKHRALEDGPPLGGGSDE
jgi:hypothetical protein